MKLAEAKVKKLISGEASVKFDQLGFNMLLARLAKNYKTDSSPTVLQESTKEINSFLVKFESIMKQDFEKMQAL